MAGTLTRKVTRGQFQEYRWPFNVLAQGHQLSKDWWREATTGIEGVSGEHEVMTDAVKQCVEFVFRGWRYLPEPQLAIGRLVIGTVQKERGRPGI